MRPFRACKGKKPEFTMKHELNNPAGDYHRSARPGVSVTF
jgi:hypothetical protein